MAARNRVRSLLIVNVAVVFLPVLLVQLAAPTFMRGRTSPVPGGAMIGALVVLLLVAASFRVALARARRAFDDRPAHASRREVLVLAAGALLVILLGQSLLSALAEAIGVVRPAATGGAAGFAIDYPRYILITTLAYAWTVSVLTLLAVSLTVGFTRAVAEGNLTVWWRRARVAAVLAAATAMVVFALKVVQHLG
jgi:hypothetical protein